MLHGNRGRTKGEMARQMRRVETPPERPESRNELLEVADKVSRILDQGNDVEIKRSKDGKIKVFEVEKHIA